MSTSPRQDWAWQAVPSDMRVRVLVVLGLAFAVIVGALVGVHAATRKPVLGRVQVDTMAAEAGQVVGSWTTAPRPAKTQHPLSFLVADATVAAVPLFSSPGKPMTGRPPLANPTSEDLPVVFLTKERRGAWLKVLVSVRPNGTEAWIRMADVKLRRVPNWIRVELGARKVTVFHGDTSVFEATGAVGRDSAPTPTGLFFVDGLVRLADPNGVYGYGQISVSGFSDVYQTFGGGVGQIALHGTNANGLLGQAVSHGCVRLDNDALKRVMGLSPTGTPVEILA